MMNKRVYFIFFHLLAWALLMAGVAVWRPRPLHDSGLSGLQVALLFIPYIGLFYLQAYCLVPGWLYRRKIGAYLSVTVLSWILAAALSGVIFYWSAASGEEDPPIYFFPVRRLTSGFIFLTAGAMFGAFLENIRREKISKGRETEHLRAELTLLRAQVNPHFMLNVLNSMVLLARRKSDLLEPVLVQLGDLMNYMLYTSDGEKVSLRHEIGYLRAYIDLQLLRYGQDVKVRFDHPEEVDGKCVAPMLLIPLVENAFKHGIGLVKDPVIHVELSITPEDRLMLTVKNRYSRSVYGSAPQAGIGISNLKKRLGLSFGDRYELEISCPFEPDPEAIAEGWFIITLIIPFI
jgi:two-component system LytT family sensor kinase